MSDQLAWLRRYERRESIWIFLAMLALGAGILIGAYLSTAHAPVQPADVPRVDRPEE